MKRLGNFFLSSVLYKKIYDEEGDYIGKLSDIYVTTEDGIPRVIGYRVKKNGEVFNCEFKHIGFYEDNNNTIIKVYGEREIMLQKYSYLLSKHLLDRQIVDINGKKLVRVNDLRITELAGEFRVIAVDCSALGLARRLGVESLARKFYSFVGRQPEDTLIVWDNVEALDMMENNLILSVPYKKLSKLHPADLADILEDMDINYRKKVFESLEKDLAADTLEEIEPDIQADIIENMSETKREEILDSIPNDEIADMLDEVDDEIKEKILLEMEKEDADEIRTLMEYEEELVGSIMNKDFIAFNLNITAQETIELLREINPEEEVCHYIYITDENGRLQGIVSLKDLILAPLDKKLKEIMDENVIFVSDDASVDEAIEITSKYDILSLPVINEAEELCGIVILNDIIEDILIPTWRKTFKKVG